MVDKLKLAWVDAIFYCRQFNMDLLEIANSEEQAFILSQIQMQTTDDLMLYTGATNLITNDFKWFWFQSNKTVNFQMLWYPENRYNLLNSNCLTLRNCGDKFGFYKVDCETPYGFVCQEKREGTSNIELAKRLHHVLSQRIM